MGRPEAPVPTGGGADRRGSGRTGRIGVDGGLQP